jgi:hypothetical protein
MPLERRWLIKCQMVLDQPTSRTVSDRTSGLNSNRTTWTMPGIALPFDLDPRMFEIELVANDFDVGEEREKAVAK